MANLLTSIFKTINPFGNKITNKSAPTSMNVSYGGGSNDELINYIGNFSTGSSHNLADCGGIMKALKDCPPINYILYKKAMMFINGKLKVIDERTNVEITDYSKFKYNQLLKTPNLLQSDIQFRIQVMMITIAYGYCPILKIRGPFNTITALYILHPAYCTFKSNGKLMNQTNYCDCFDSIEFNKKPIPKEDVYVFTDITPYNDNSLFPETRLNACKMVISTIAENYKARLSLMKHRGAKGILTNQSIVDGTTKPILTSEREQLQKDFKKYNFNGGDFDTIISGHNLSWQNMSIPMKDMLLTEQEEHDIMTLCDALGFEHMLLSRGSDATYTNKPQAERFQYQNSTIPESINYQQQLNDCLEISKEKVVITYDFSHVSILQDDLKLKSEAYRNTVSSAVELFTNNGCTFKAYLEMCQQPNDKASDLFFYQMPKDFQESFKNRSTNNNQNNVNNGN